MVEQEKKNIIQSLDRGLQLLEVVAREPEQLTLNELAARFSMDKSSIFRLLATLAGRGYVRQEQGSKKYRLGYRILELAGDLYRDLKIVEEARPYLKELSAGIRETAHLAVHSDGKMIFIDREMSDRIIGVNTHVGRREPLHCTALGKVLLSAFSEEELESFVGRKGLPKYTPNTITNVEDLKTELQKIRQQGYAFDNEEFREGIRCLASLVYDYRDVAVCAVGISGPDSRITLDSLDELAGLVKDTAAKISLRLGYNPNYRVGE